MISAALLLLSQSLFLSLHLSPTPSSFPRPLSAQEEEACLARWAAGDLEARNCLVEHNLRLVAHIIKKYYTTADTLEDFNRKHQIIVDSVRVLDTEGRDIMRHDLLPDLQ